MIYLNSWSDLFAVKTQVDKEYLDDFGMIKKQFMWILYASGIGIMLHVSSTPNTGFSDLFVISVYFGLPLAISFLRNAQLKQITSFITFYTIMLIMLNVLCFVGIQVLLKYGFSPTF